MDIYKGWSKITKKGKLTIILTINKEGEVNNKKSLKLPKQQTQ